MICRSRGHTLRFSTTVPNCKGKNPSIAEISRGALLVFECHPIHELQDKKMLKGPPTLSQGRPLRCLSQYPDEYPNRPVYKHQNNISVCVKYRVKVLMLEAPLLWVFTHIYIEERRVTLPVVQPSMSGDRLGLAYLGTHSMPCIYGNGSHL